MITKTSIARHLMRWETGGVKAVALGLVTVREFQLFSASFLQAFSELLTTTSGVYPVGLKSATPKMH